MGVEEHFEFISVLYEAVGIPDGKHKKFGHFDEFSKDGCEEV
jgi:hypothetical protein